MTEKTPYQLVEEIIEVVDEHGFTTDSVDNVEALRCALNDILYKNPPQQYAKWWETYHNGNN